MELISFRHHFSRNTLLLMLLVAVLIGAMLYWKQDLLQSIYLRDQLTHVGLVINGAIVALFLIGMLKIILILFSYRREEAAIRRFINNLNHPDRDPLQQVAANSIIGRRQATLMHLHQTNTVIDQGALASTLLANESTRTSLPRFINNTLILTGVFGTIVSLSMALLGASDMLGNAFNVDGMGQVVHGMSTALSTTVTAILCYLYFGYFFLKLTDAQTNLVSAVEQVTSTYLLPRYQIQTDSVLYEFTGLIRSLQTLVQQMATTQENMSTMEQNLQSTLDANCNRLQQLDQDMQTIVRVLRDGFRLSD